MPTERFQFTGEGGHQLAAALDMPEREPKAYALFAHCFTCGKDVLAAKRIAVALAAKGIAVLRFDFTGLGSSEGDFANSTFSSNVADLVRAADHLRETRKAPTILIGHSLGGRLHSVQMLRCKPSLSPGRIFPFNFSAGFIDCIEIPVVAQEIHQSVGNRRTGRNSPASFELPFFRSSGQIQRVKVMVVASKKHRAICHHR